MRLLRYHVAMSLDGFIADAAGGHDWIEPDPAIDFAALFAQFDTFVMGRKTFEVFRKEVPPNFSGDKRVIVASRTLRAEAHPGVTVVREGIESAVAALKREAGKDIWLFGGGELFRTLLDAGLVDRIEVAVIPRLLGGGTPLIAPGKPSPRLKLFGQKTYPNGIVMLGYEVGR